MPEFQSLLERLLKNGVEFVVIGGHAAAAHGATLVTFDLDIACRFTPENLLRLQKVVADLHPVHRMTPKRLPLDLDAHSCRGLKNLYLSTDWGQLDCLGAVTGIGGFDAVVENSVTLDLPFGDCRFLSLDSLIRSKQAMGRPRDREAVIQLRAIREHSGGK